MQNPAVRQNAATRKLSLISSGIARVRSVPGGSLLSSHVFTSLGAALAIGAASFVPAIATAQTISFGAGPSVAIGPTNDRLGNGYTILAAIGTRTPLSFLDFRLDGTFTELRSKPVRGGKARMGALSANVAASIPRAAFAYLVSGVGMYRSSLARAPIAIDATTDIGFNIGAGLKARVKRRGREDQPHEDLNVFLEGRLHFVLTDVKPTMFLPITGGFRLFTR